MTKISEKTIVWITGASSGIGEALTYQLAAKKAKIIISSRRKDELERVKSNCPFPENIGIVTLDLSDSNSLQSKSDEAQALFGAIDLLINNGGISQRDKAMHTSLEVDRRLMEINYFGSIALSKSLLSQMVKRKTGHHVIITSAVGIISTPLRSAYAASKHALHGFYDALRAEHHHDGMKVTIVCPGYVKTMISINALMGDGKQQGKMDKAQEKGLTPEYCAAQIIQSIEKNKEEVYIGGLKEVSAIYVKRFFPGLFSRMVRKLAVT